MRIALGDGPDPDAFAPDVIEREAADAGELDELGVRLIPIASPDYPERLRDGGPVLLQVAGSARLLDDEGVRVFTKVRGPQGQELVDTLEGGGRAIVVLSKGMLKARSLLRGMAQYLDDGAVTLVTAEPPRAAWGPTRDVRRDQLGRAASGSLSHNFCTSCRRGAEAQRSPRDRRTGPECSPLLS